MLVAKCKYSVQRGNNSAKSVNDFIIEPPTRAADNWKSGFICVDLCASENTVAAELSYGRGKCVLRSLRLEQRFIKSTM